MVEIDTDEVPLDKRTDISIKATLYLSGTKVIVGVYKHVEDDSLFICFDELEEPIYFSKAESKLLVSALKASVADLED